MINKISLDNNCGNWNNLEVMKVLSTVSKL